MNHNRLSSTVIRHLEGYAHPFLLLANHDFLTTKDHLANFLPSGLFTNHPYKVFPYASFLEGEKFWSRSFSAGAGVWGVA